MSANGVWVLSVNLETKSATFVSGLGDAAKAARGSFNDIKGGAAEMGRSTSTNMMEARHGVMLLGEEFGIHLPRALTSFIASLGPIGAAMSAAFPFLAIIVGATLLYEHLQKIKQAGEQLTESQVNFGTTVATVLGSLNDKLLQAGIRFDELNGNHLAALEKQLQLIDHQTMTDLVQEFSKIAKAADEVFKSIDDSSFLAKHFGAGAEGAKHALQDFKTQYDNLLAQGKEDEAKGLLSGTLDRAKQVLALQEQANKSQHEKTSSPATFEAIRKLQKEGIKDTDEAVAAQRELVDTLQAQVNVQTSLNALKKLEQSNAQQSTAHTMDEESDKLARQAMADAKKEQERQDRDEEQARQEAINRIQEAERLKIAATEQGSAARLAAIDAAIKDENAKGLQETGFYRDLLKQRVDTARQMADEEKRIRAEAGREAANHEEKMDELSLDARRTAAEVRRSAMMNSEQQRIADESRFADEDYRIKALGLSQQIAALDKSDKEYENKLKALQDREIELAQQHENQLTQIKAKAEEARNTRILSAEQHFNDTIAKNLSDTLLRHQTFGRMMTSIGSEIASGMLQNAIKSILADDMTKEHDAAAAARKAFLAGMHFPFPANLVMGPTLAAAAFASVMAFQGGGLVPGVGIGDIVPAKLEPGETVIPKKMTEQLQRASDGGDSKPHVTIHHSPTYHVQTIDGDGIRQTLNKHKEEFSRHVHAELRRMNR